jgi:hypothetical protein
MFRALLLMSWVPTTGPATRQQATPYNRPRDPIPDSVRAFCGRL